MSEPDRRRGAKIRSMLLWRFMSTAVEARTEGVQRRRTRRELSSIGQQRRRYIARDLFGIHKSSKAAHMIWDSQRHVLVIITPIDWPLSGFNLGCDSESIHLLRVSRYRR